jgi:hypothetical protein
MARSSLAYILGFSVKFFFQSEQKVTTLDNDLAMNISAKYDSNQSSGF